jgi:competence protein ComEA
MVVLLACALIAGVYWFRTGVAAAPTATGRDASSPAGDGTAPTAVAPTTTTIAATAELVVHVAGAVARPGIVTLAGGSRVTDAIEAAGGAHPDADLDRLNLAAELGDGERVAVAMQGQPAPVLDVAAAAGGSATDGPTAGPVNLNTATQAELETLPGIGPTLAQAIIDERERSGGFAAVDDLRRVPGIGDARFAQVESLVAT